ncbi:MAG: hypothetical protein FJW34_15985, partial [Acidobacteria bacterium]|nr:hypothetical protein [Acidobacteriota bacterium]
MRWKTVCVLAACAAALVAQTPPVTILEIETENTVAYYQDVADPAKLASSVAISPLAPDFNWILKWTLVIGDIVAVNGKPAKGLRISRSFPPRYISSLTPGRAIADISGNCLTDVHLAILQPDGTPIGTIVASGLGGTTPPPGAPLAAASHSIAVVGGTGAFLGVRGQFGGVRDISRRNASMVEDPAYRRINGGGKRIEMVHLIPMTWPEVLA